ncbi:hypothetical protein [Paraburkholderia sp. MM5384-R2]|uniref:amino acid kinase family protein n=1 Tax=Paraburkholderia sp. MM5384-R2 TaxID=2723097 RepID=UPI00161B23C5|nr:hypothetical protein [Paraburkholderia sp. MM5384-R2]
MNTTHTTPGNTIVVVKLGSSTLTCAGDPNHALIGQLCDDLQELRAIGMHPVLVTSGAVQLGQCNVQSGTGVTTTYACQAAVGQIRLVAAFSEHLSKLGYSVAQILLKLEDFRSAGSRAEIAAVVQAFFGSNSIPLINENDVTSFGGQFPSNDELSAELVAALGAQRLIIFTDRPGVYEVDPRVDMGARLFDTISALDERLLVAASDLPTATGRGGMKSKIHAAQIAAASGAVTVITCYDEARKLSRIALDDRVGTWIVPTIGDKHSLQCRQLHLNQEKESPA